MTKTNRIKHLLIDSNAEGWGGFLFDWKTAILHKLLIICVFLIDFKVSTDLVLSELFPFWKQLEQSGHLFKLKIVK